MAKFIVRRLLLMAVTMLAVSILVFLVSEIAPGNIARNILGAFVTPEQEKSFMAQLGYNRPLLTRYVSWLIGSDWHAEQLIGMPLQRIRDERGFPEWWAVDQDGTLVRWKADGTDLIALRRRPDGTVQEVADNERWREDASGTRYAWGVNQANRAAKWVQAKPAPASCAVDLRFADNTVLGETDLTDASGLAVRANAGAERPGALPPGTWTTREIDLSSLSGRELASVQLAVDYDAPATEFPVQVTVYVDQVEIVGADGSTIWRGELGGKGFRGTAVGKRGETTGAMVDALAEGISASEPRVFKVSGRLLAEQPAVRYSLFDKLAVTIPDGARLRYRTFCSALLSSHTSWTLASSGSGFVATAGGPVEFIPLSRGFLRGDPGESLKTGRPVIESLVRALRNSLFLAAIAFAIIMPLALLLGLIAGMNEGKFLDRLLSILGLMTTATPQFATGVFLILVFASWLKWLPGATLFPSDNAIFQNPQMLVLPVLTLTLIELGYVLRITRSSMVEVMRQPYIRTAFLKGLPYWRIIFKHALRNALLAPITVIMLHVNWLIGGIVVVEAIFGFPGLGKLIYEAALFKDVAAVEGGAMVMVALAVSTQLLADIAYTFLNPRIRYS
ncbi:MAG TPA: ABC transporter permease subunit [Anaerolineae bacterium]|nr:ABC transporter permease subunit [Anaerolineae bacterium]HOQ97403.1 ABC transporter permease subunit [Anaerolineae bacterium]HPL27172.1 ABC transporter permease subunit [Anaerolineae bacterium]